MSARVCVFLHVFREFQHFLREKRISINNDGGVVSKATSSMHESRRNAMCFQWYRLFMSIGKLKMYTECMFLRNSTSTSICILMMFHVINIKHSFTSITYLRITNKPNRRKKVYIHQIETHLAIKSRWFKNKINHPHSDLISTFLWSDFFFSLYLIFRAMWSSA